MIMIMKVNIRICPRGTKNDIFLSFARHDISFKRC
jgi:hypothetical protein